MYMCSILEYGQNKVTKNVKSIHNFKYFVLLAQKIYKNSNKMTLMGNRKTKIQIKIFLFRKLQYKV